MVFRITPQHFAANSIRYSQGHTSNLEKLQSQISSGLRVQKPSDDPGVLGMLLSNKASIARISVETDNMEVARSKLNQSVAQLLSAKEAVSRANSLALEGVQALEDERETLAREVDGILQLMLQIANSTDGGKPLYAGTSRTLTPFTSTRAGDSDSIQSVQYHGSNERSRIVVGVLTTVDSLYTGEEIFMSRGRGETIFLGTTGASSGPGTDSAVGRGELAVQHTTTNFGGASGLAPGISTSDDTILGNYTLTIDGIGQTLSLDGGNPVAFTKGDPDVRVIAPNGAMVHLDTAGFVDGFTGDVPVQGDGTLSIDGGLSQIAIDFSENQAVVNSETGEVTNVDTRGVRAAGIEPVEYTDTSNVFQALIDLRDELRNTNNLEGTDWSDALSRRVGDIQRIHEQLLDVISEQSVALENLDAMQSRAEEYQLETQHTVAQMESADIPAAIVQLQTEQNALQYTYAVSVQVMSSSLLDFLR